jgi:EDD domain protein, DegV family
MAYQIFSDSSCDLPDQLLKEHDIKLIPFYVTFDQDNYYKENVEITNEAFYERLSQPNTYSTTSLPSVQDYMSEFRRTIKNGSDIICLCLSHQLSGSFQSAYNAKEILEEQYPVANIHIIDSHQATAGQGLVLLQLAYMKEAGYSIDEAVEKLNLIKPTARIMFTVDTLDYLDKGRRIGKAAALAGNLLDVKPLIQLTGAELIPYSNIRGRKKSLDQIVTMVKEYFIETSEKTEEYDFCITDATTPEDAAYLQRQVEAFIGREIEYPIFQIGVTIGTYTGPGGIGICFVKKYNYI